MNSPVGKDGLTLDSLMQPGYYTAFIVTGAHKGLPLGVPTEDPNWYNQRYLLP